MSAEMAKLYKKMTGVMSRMDRIEKRGHNSFFNYDFVTSDDVLDAVRKAMAAEGLALFVNIIKVEAIETGGKDKAGNPKFKTVADFEFCFADSETGETLPCIWKGEAIDTEDKAVSKCATSAEKYFLLKTFLIGTGDEPDPDASDENGKEAAQKRQPQPQKPAARGDITKDLAHLSGVLDRNGNAYLMLSDDELDGRKIGIRKAIEKNGLTDEQKQEYTRKLNAIDEIQTWRRSHPSA